MDTQTYDPDEQEYSDLYASDIDVMDDFYVEEDWECAENVCENNGRSRKISRKRSGKKDSDEEYYMFLQACLRYSIL